MMSKIVDEIISDMKKNPEHWFRVRDDLVNGELNVNVTSLGNTRLFSVLDLHVNGEKIRILTFIDRWRLESASCKLLRQIPLKRTCIK